MDAFPWMDPHADLVGTRIPADPSGLTEIHPAAGPRMLPKRQQGIQAYPELWDGKGS